MQTIYKFFRILNFESKQGLSISLANLEVGDKEANLWRVNKTKQQAQEPIEIYHFISRWLFYEGKSLNYYPQL